MVNARPVKGIIYEIDTKDNLIYLGISEGGGDRHWASIPNKAFETFGEYSLEEILHKIVKKARGDNSLDFWLACPRNVAMTATDKINNYLAKLYREQRGTSYEGYVKASKTVRKMIEEMKTKTPGGKLRFTNWDVMSWIDVKKKGVRRATGARDTTRYTLEMLICEGKVRKLVEGGEDIQGRQNASRYETCE